MMSLLTTTLGIPVIISYALILAIICGVMAWAFDLIAHIIDYIIKKWREANKH